MHRTHSFLAVLAVLATFIPSSASAQEDCAVFVKRVVDGAEMRICSDRATPRVISAAATAAASLDARRGASTVTSPEVASTSVTPAYGWGVPTGYGGTGYVPPPPPDYTTALELRDALLLGVQVTSHEEQARAAADRGIRDGQHEAVMGAIASLRDQIAGSERRLRTAIANGDERLARELSAQKADLERRLAEQTAAATSAPAPAPVTPPPAPPIPTPADVAHLVPDPADCDRVDARFDPDKCRVALPVVGP